MNVLTLWDGTHFFGDNCPSNGCSMYHLTASMMRLMLMIMIVLITFDVFKTWNVMMTMEMFEVEMKEKLRNDDML